MTVYGIKVNFYDIKMKAYLKNGFAGKKSEAYDLRINFFTFN